MLHRHQSELGEATVLLWWHDGITKINNMAYVYQVESWQAKPNANRIYSRAHW